MQSDRPPFECLIGEVDATPVGMALYFQSYSTWKGVPGLYLEDLYVQPAHRGAGMAGPYSQNLRRLLSIGVSPGSIGVSSTGIRRRSSSTKASMLR